MKLFASCVLVAALAALAGCQSSIRPLEPLREVEYDETGHIYEIAATAPATTSAPTTQAETFRAGDKILAVNGKKVESGFLEFTDVMVQAALTNSPASFTVERDGRVIDIVSVPKSPSTAPASQPVRKTRMVDPNQVVRYAYRVNYDYLWEKSLAMLSDLGYTVDRQDYRLGVLITKPNFSSHVIEPWKPDHTTPSAAMENSINSQRRIIRVTISRAPNPAFYEVGVQVLVERQSNPSETITGPIGTLAGRGISQGTDIVGPAEDAQSWRTLGHDPELERKVIDILFKSL